MHMADVKTDTILERIAIWENRWCNVSVMGQDNIAVTAVLDELYALIGGRFEWETTFDRVTERRKTK